MRTACRTCVVIVLGVALLSHRCPRHASDFMEMETIQFMHFNVDTAWQPDDAFLHGKPNVP